MRVSIHRLICTGFVLWFTLVPSLESQPTPPSGLAFGAGFQPGGQQLFVLDLAGTPVGDAPNTIRLLRGNVEVVLQGGARMLKASTASEFLITLPQVLPADFTLEFDLIPKAGGPPPDLSIEGTPTINQGVASAHLLWQTDYLAVVGGAQDNFETPMPEDLKATLPGVRTQIGVSVGGSTIKLYTNGRRLYTLDRVFARGGVLRVSLGGVDDANAVYLAGLRIATGTPVLAANPTLPVPGTTTYVPPVPGAPPQPPTPAPAPAALGPSPLPVVNQPGGQQTASQSQASTASLLPTVVSNVSVTQGAPGPIVTWSPVAQQAGYAVRRWKIDDLVCCNNSSYGAGPAPPLSGPPWQDVQPSVAGTYVYEVTAFMTGGAKATGQAQFVVLRSAGRVATATPPPPTSVITAAPPPPPPPATALPATPATGTITPLPAGSTAGTTLPQHPPSTIQKSRLNCGLLSNLSAKATSSTSVFITWGGISLTCQTMAKLQNETLEFWGLVRWFTADGNVCPATYDEYAKTQVWGGNGSYTSTLDSRCHEFFYDLWWGAKDVNDYGLTAGGTYSYRIYPGITATCAVSPTCPWGTELRGYAPADVTVTLPNPLTPGKRPQVSLIPPKLFLQATVQPGIHSGGWYGNELWRSVFYAWAPTASATAYVLSFDALEWEVWGSQWVEVTTATVQASPNPTYTVLVPAKTVRACIAIVTDPVSLPDPRKGECIQTDVP